MIIQFNRYDLLVIAASAVLFNAGCQTGLQGVPNLSNFNMNTLNSPARVPPPASGSYTTPSNYNGTPLGQSSNLKPTTMSQLRSIETGSEDAGVFGSEGFASGGISDRSVVARPVMTASIKPSSQASANNASQRNDVTNRAFDGETDQSVVLASTTASLPDPRAAVGALSDTALFSTISDKSETQMQSEPLRWRQ